MNVEKETVVRERLDYTGEYHVAYFESEVAAAEESREEPPVAFLIGGGKKVTPAGKQVSLNALFARRELVADRLLTVWNACAGIKSEDIETTPIKDMAGEIKSLKKQVASLEEKLAKAKEKTTAKAEKKGSKGVIDWASQAIKQLKQGTKFLGIYMNVRSFADDMALAIEATTSAMADGESEVRTKALALVDEYRTYAKEVDGVQDEEEPETAPVATDDSGTKPGVAGDVPAAPADAPEGDPGEGDGGGTGDVSDVPEVVGSVPE